MKTSNLLDAEFKTLVIRMLSELRGRVDEAENQISSFEHKEAKYAQSEQ